MFSNLLASVLVLFISVQVGAQPKPVFTGGCVDCFNFVAPTIAGAENVDPAEVGLIVYDSTYGIFRGQTYGGTWAKLSDEQVVHSVTSSITVPKTDDHVNVNATSGALTMTLVAAASVPGKEYVFKKTDSSANLVTIDGNSTETIDGAATQTLKFQNDAIRIVSDGTNWSMTGRFRATVAPTIQKFTTGSGTYTTPAGAIYIRVRMVGGGGGGGGGNTSATAGGNGGNTTFGTSLLVANGGSGGGAGGGGVGGDGGTASLGTGPIGAAFTGGWGFASYANVSGGGGGAGGITPFGGAGTGGTPGLQNAQSAKTNTGSGGGGALATGGTGGGGGGAGGYVDAIISSPSSTYSYAVGAAGAQGTGSNNGGNGALGFIIVEEYY